MRSLIVHLAIIVCLTFGSSFSAMAQDVCGFETKHTQLMKDSSYAARHNAFEAKVLQIISNKGTTAYNEAAVVYTIPVVVHVLHLGEAVGVGTNISDAQIQSAIDQLTVFYRGDGGASVDVEVEFALAKQDESCISTTGINRVDASGVTGYSADGIYLNTVGADENTLKDLSRWDETQYFNIWIVSEIDGNNGGAGTQGYANFYYGNAYEGSVMMYSVFGYDPPGDETWTLNGSRDAATVLHEVGHYLHLYHTFIGDGDADMDGIGDACPLNVTVGTDSDGCTDTEIHKRHTSQCLSGTTNDCTGSTYSDNVAKNYMAYTSCRALLTSDQNTRARTQLDDNMESITQSRGDETPIAIPAVVAASCTPTTIPAPTVNNSGITRTSLNGFTVSSGSSFADGGYVDHTAECAKYFSLNATVPDTIEIDVYSLNVQQLHVWIDWNNDGDFDDADEAQHSEEDIAAGTRVKVPIIYPSYTTFTSSVRMRVLTDLDDQYANAVDLTSACDNPYYGQGEDYKIYIETPSQLIIAQFEANNTVINTGGSVNFTDHSYSLNTITSWTWSFAGGTPATSTAQNPASITYSNPGEYPVSLTVTSSDGTDPKTISKYISVCAGLTTASCFPTITTPHSGLGITNVELNGVNFPTSSSAVDGGNIDSSASCINYFSIDADVSNTINVTVLNANSHQIYVAIDWNNDGDFIDANEFQHYSTSITAGATVPVAIIYPTIIPYNSAVRLRVLDDFAGASIITSACHALTFGQGEDYKIFVLDNSIKPTPSFTASTTTPCIAATVDFTDTSTDQPYAWQWTFTGGTPSSSTLQNPMGITYAGTGSYDVQLIVSNSAGGDTLKSVDYITVTICGELWIGTTDTDWGTATNWQGGSVPASGDDIVIPSATNTPVLDMNRTIGTLSLQSGGIINLNGFELTVQEDWTNTGGTISSNAGGVKFAGSSAQSISGTQTFSDVEISNSTGVNIVSGTSSITGVLTLTAGTFTTNDALTLVSDAAGTACITTIPVGPDITGKVNVQRYIDAGATNWHFFSSPIASGTLADWNDDFTTSGIVGSDYPDWPTPVEPWVSIYSYDETVAGAVVNGYVTPSNMTNVIGDGQGYWVWCGDNSAGTAPFTIDMNGSINKGDISMPVSYTNSGLPDDDGWNMVGNPYPCTIDWDDVDWVKTNIDDAVYIYDPDNDQYASYVAGVPNNGGSQYIPSLQGFYVKASATGPVLTAKETIKSTVDPTFFKSSGASPFRINVAMGTYNDQVSFSINPGASMNYDSQYDAFKLFSTSANVPSICALSEDNRELSINSFNSTGTIRIPVKITSWSSGNAELTFENVLAFSAFKCVYLEDLQTNTIIDLFTSAGYTFSLSSQTNTARFILHLEDIVSDFNSVDTVYLSSNNGAYTPTNTSVNAVQYLWDFGDNSSSTLVNPTHNYTQSGIYNVQLVAEVAQTCSDVTEKQVQVLLSPQSVEELALNNVIIYPNPVRIGTQLYFELIETTNYYIEIVDFIGRTILEETIARPSASVEIAGKFDSGMYLLSVYHDNHKLLNTVKLSVIK